MTELGVITLAAGSDSYLVASMVLGGLALFFLFLELFVPTSGMLALLCGGCAIASVVAMFMWSTTAGLLLLLGYTFATPFLIYFLLKLWAKSPLVKRYSLNEGPSKVVTAETVVEGADPEGEGVPSELARFRRLQALNALVGRRGVTETPLRPAGFITLDGKRIDAAAESGLIDAGVPVRVVAVVDAVLKVRAE